MRRRTREWSFLMPESAEAGENLRLILTRTSRAAKGTVCLELQIVYASLVRRVAGGSVESREILLARSSAPHRASRSASSQRQGCSSGIICDCWHARATAACTPRAHCPRHTTRRTQRRTLALKLAHYAQQRAYGVVEHVQLAVPRARGHLCLQHCVYRRA
ncbi:hypothetical protein BC834DRAFT_146182 [Gloeopeniophorella convolvens]|nr:hypothetical protein BC834DRAFT_146182 [Gloeopeniophorella convolvens]